MRLFPSVYVSDGVRIGLKPRSSTVVQHAWLAWNEVVVGRAWLEIVADDLIHIVVVLLEILAVAYGGVVRVVAMPVTIHVAVS